MRDVVGRLQYDCHSSVFGPTFTRQGSQVRTLHRPPKTENQARAAPLWRRFCLDHREYCLGGITSPTLKPMTKLLAAPLLLALNAATIGAEASTPIAELRWSADGRFVHQAQIKPKAFVEVCGELAANTSVSWSFKATHPLDFNVHYHVGKNVVYPVKPSRLESASDSLTVTDTQHYCWMWTNKGPETVTLRTELRR